MRVPQKRWIEGKTIASVDWQPFPDGRGGTAYDPIIRFSDGSCLYFVVHETECGEYGINPGYVPKTNKVYL